MFEGLRILVVGDVMLDRYWIGTADRISPEAPVPILLLQHEENRLGGAANVALNLRALKVNVVLLSMVGSDLAGQQLCTCLETADINNAYILPSERRKTTVKTRMIARGHQVLRLDDECISPLEHPDEQALLKAFNTILYEQKIEVIVIQDYNKGLLTPTVIDYILDEAHQKHIAVVVDPKSDNFFRYNGVAVFKPNWREATEAFGIWQGQIPTQIRLDALGTQLQERLKGALIMITLGDMGVYVKQTDTPQGFLLPAAPRRVADVCGAGDAVISVIAAATALKMSAYSLALLANIAGGMVCEQVGVCPVHLERLLEEYAHASKDTQQK